MTLGRSVGQPCFAGLPRVLVFHGQDDTSCVQVASCEEDRQSRHHQSLSFRRVGLTRLQGPWAMGPAAASGWPTSAGLCVRHVSWQGRPTQHVHVAAVFHPPCLSVRGHCVHWSTHSAPPHTPGGRPARGGGRLLHARRPPGSALRRPPSPFCAPSWWCRHGRCSCCHGHCSRMANVQAHVIGDGRSRGSRRLGVGVATCQRAWTCVRRRW